MRSREFQECRIEVACDVDNPLVGPIWRGGGIRSTESGATPETVETLEMDYVIMPVSLHAPTDATCLKYRAERRGMGIAAVVFPEAEMKPGIEIVMQAVKLE